MKRIVCRVDFDGRIEAKEGMTIQESRKQKRGANRKAGLFTVKRAMELLASGSTTS